MTWCAQNVDKVSGVDRNEHGNLVALRQCAKRRQAEQYALVLTAMGVWSLIAPEGKVLTLYVAHEDAERANDELTAYDSENRKHLPRRDRRHPAFPRIEVAMIYWAVLLFFFAASRRDAFSLDWVGEGAAQAGLMLKGEWWRAVTALCLHVNAEHLLGNLVFGTVILLLLAQVTGAGVAWLSMIVAGAAGNALNALAHSPTHTSIGASTAIFAGIGLLAVLRQVRRPERAIFSLRNWVPLAGGATLLVFLGLSGEQTDILGHVLGFGSGIAAGWGLARWDRDWSVDRDLQWMCAGTAGAVVTAAWLVAVVELSVSVPEAAAGKLVLSAGLDQLAHENGPIENLQVVALAFAYVLFCLQATKEPGAARTAAVALAGLCFILLLREVDFRIYDVSDWLITVTSGHGRRVIIWLVASLTVIYVLSRFRHLPSLIRSSLTWKAWPFYLWLPLFLVGQGIEVWTNEARHDALQGYWGNGQFWEELFELNAYLALLYAAFVFSDVYGSSGPPGTARAQDR
jgi:membrane associated rhomboid family serine protease